LPLQTHAQQQQQTIPAIGLVVFTVQGFLRSPVLAIIREELAQLGYVEDKNYFNTLVMYIHNNPKRHGFVDDFKEWTFTSYHEILSDEPTFLQRNEVLQWFGGKEAFIQLHEEYSKQKQEEDERWHIE